MNEDITEIVTYFFNKIRDDNERFAEAMNHILTDSDKCPGCKEVQLSERHPSNKFCELGKLSIQLEGCEKHWINPKKYLKYISTELKEQIERINENKKRYESFYPKMKKEMKQREADYFKKFKNNKQRFADDFSDKNEIDMDEDTDTESESRRTKRARL